MILKGSARSGATDLALHLSNEVDNEIVTIAEMRGMASQSLYEGFREWELICNQTKASKAFYSLSINPDTAQREWSDEEWQSSIDHIEGELGLTDQPRAIVFHEKAGTSDGNIRKHCHVVWSRVDGETLKAIPQAHDYHILKRCSHELAHKFGLEINHGTQEGYTYDQAMAHGANRDVETSTERKTTITKLWAEHETKAAFGIAMSNAGYVIAQGDKRPFVVVDRDGEVHSLSRQIDKVKLAAVKDRLGELQSYPSVEQAKDEQLIRALDQERVIDTPEPPKRQDLTKEQKLFRKLRRMAQRTDQLRIKRQAGIKAREDETERRYKAAQDKLKRAYRGEEVKTLKQRKTKEQSRPQWLSSLVPYDMLLKWKHAHEDHGRVKRFERQKADLESRYAKQQEWIARKVDILAKQERREAASYARFAKQLKLGQAHEIRFGELAQDRQIELSF